MDLATVLKAIELVGHATPAAFQLYEGFIQLATDKTEAGTLAARYAEARTASDRLHDEMQARFAAR